MKASERRKKNETLIQTRFGSFLCVFESNHPEKGFTVTSPAARGFVTYGTTLQSARKMAREGLEFHYECTVLEQFPPQERMLRFAER